MHLTKTKKAKRLARSKSIAKKLNMGRNTKNSTMRQHNSQSFMMPGKVNQFGTANSNAHAVKKATKNDNGLGSKWKSLFSKLINGESSPK